MQTFLKALTRGDLPPRKMSLLVLKAWLGRKLHPTGWLMWLLRLRQQQWQEPCLRLL